MSFRITRIKTETWNTCLRCQLKTHKYAQNYRCVCMCHACVWGPDLAVTIFKVFPCTEQLYCAGCKILVLESSKCMIRPSCGKARVIRPSCRPNHSHWRFFILYFGCTCCKIIRTLLPNSVCVQSRTHIRGQAFCISLLA